MREREREKRAKLLGSGILLNKERRDSNPVFDWPNPGIMFSDHFI